MKKFIAKTCSTLMVLALLATSIPSVAFAMAPTLSVTNGGFAVLLNGSGEATIQQDVGTPANLQFMAWNPAGTPVVVLGLDANNNNFIEPGENVTAQASIVQTTPTTKVLAYTYTFTTTAEQNLLAITHYNGEMRTVKLHMQGQQTAPPPPVLQPLTLAVDAEGQTNVPENTVVSKRNGERATITIRSTNPNAGQPAPIITAAIGATGRPLNSHSSVGSTTTATYEFAPALITQTYDSTIRFTATVPSGAANPVSKGFNIILRFDAGPTQTVGNLTMNVAGAPSALQWSVVSGGLTEPLTTTAGSDTKTLTNKPTNVAYTFNLVSPLPSGYTITATNSANATTGTTSITIPANRPTADASVTFTLQQQQQPPQLQPLDAIEVDVDGQINVAQNTVVSRRNGERALITIRATNPNTGKAAPIITAAIGTLGYPLNSHDSVGGTTTATYEFAPTLISHTEDKTMVFTATVPAGEANPVDRHFNIILRFDAGPAQTVGNLTMNVVGAPSALQWSVTSAGLTEPLTTTAGSDTKTLTNKPTNISYTFTLVSPLPANYTLTASNSANATTGTTSITIPANRPTADASVTFTFRPVTQLQALTMEVDVDTQTNVAQNFTVSRRNGERALITIRATNPNVGKAAPIITAAIGTTDYPLNSQSTAGITTTATFEFRPGLTTTNSTATIMFTATVPTGDANPVSKSFPIVLQWVNTSQDFGNLTLNVIDAPSIFNWTITGSTPADHLTTAAGTDSKVLSNKPTDTAFTFTLDEAVPTGYSLQSSNSINATTGTTFITIPANRVAFDASVTFRFTRNVDPDPTEPPRFVSVVHNNIDYVAQGTNTISTRSTTPFTVDVMVANPVGFRRPNITATVNGSPVSVNTTDGVESNQRRAVLSFAGGFVTGAVYTVVFTASNTNGSTPFTLTVTANDAVTLAVTNETNTSPIADNSTISLNTNDPLPTIHVVATDPDSGIRPTLTISTNIPGNPQLAINNPPENNRQAGTLFGNGFIIPTAGNYVVNISSRDSLQPVATLHRIYITVINPGGGTTNHTPDIGIRNETDTQTINPANFAAVVGTELKFIVKATDPDTSQTLSIVASQMPTGATLTPASGTSPLASLFKWTPTIADQGTTKTITFSVNDGNGGTASVTSTIVAGGTPLTQDENLLKLQFPNNSDVPESYAMVTGTAITIHAVTTGANTTVTFESTDTTTVPVTLFNQSTNNFTFTPTAAGTYTLSFTASDPDASTADTDTVTLVITVQGGTNGGDDNGGPPSGGTTARPSNQASGGRPIRSRIEQLQRDINEIILDDGPIPEHCKFPDIGRYPQATQKKIITLCKLGLFTGDDGTGNFRPFNPMNRAEFTKAMVQFGYNKSVTDAMERFVRTNALDFFPDVLHNYWYAKYVGVGLQYEHFHGYPEGYFGPNKTINIAEALKILINIAKEDNDFVKQVYENQKVLARDPWFAKYDKTAITLEVLNGNFNTIIGNLYDPGGQRGFDLSRTLRRVQAAELIYDIIMSVPAE